MSFTSIFPALFFFHIYIYIFALGHAVIQAKNRYIQWRYKVTDRIWYKTQSFTSITFTSKKYLSASWQGNTTIANMWHLLQVKLAWTPLNNQSKVANQSLIINRLLTITFIIDSVFFLPLLDDCSSGVLDLVLVPFFHQHDQKQIKLSKSSLKTLYIINSWQDE